MEALPLLKEDLENDDPEIRVEAMSRVSSIAVLLGAARFESDLLRLLSDFAQAEGQHDQVLQVLAEQLGQCIPLLPTARLVCLVDLLVFLCKADETVVRDKAAEALQTVLRGLDARAVVEVAVPAIQGLVTTEWFTGRVSAASLFAAAYAPLAAAAAVAAGEGGSSSSSSPGEGCATLRKLFATLCEDETPMVRRAAARQLGALAAAYEREPLAAELLPQYLVLAQDEQETVRLLALECTRGLCSALAPAERVSALLPLIKACAGDKSWKVRNIMARDFHALSVDFGAGLAGEQLLPLLRRLTRDPEGEVRASSARAVAGYVGLLGLDRLTGDIVPALLDGITDPLFSVRVAAIETLMQLSAHLTQEQAHRLVMPSMLAALKDDVPEVRLAVLASLARVAPVLGGDKVDSTLVPILTELAQDRMWRVRDSVISQLPLLTQSIVSRGGGGAPQALLLSSGLAAHTNPRISHAPTHPPHPPPCLSPQGVALFQEKLLPIYLGCFQDQVYAVRARAVSSISELVSATSEAWSMAHILPKMVELFHERDNTYLQRITALQGIRELALRATSPEAMALVLPVLEKAAGDGVPNVRAVCTRVLGEVAASKGLLTAAQMEGVVVPALGRLAEDPSDQEVRFLAGFYRKGLSL